MRVARFHWRFRPQLVAIACRPVLKNDVGFFSYEIQTFQILYNAEKIKNKILCLMFEKHLWWRVISLKADPR